MKLAALASLAAALLSSLALTLPLASQAATGNGTGTAGPGKPLVSTGGVSHVTSTSAALGGTVNPRTLATTYYFQYGPTAAYGLQTAPGTLPAGTSAKVKVSLTASGILTGYHYRLVASNAAGTTDGHDKTFSAKKAKNGFVLPQAFAPTPLGGTFVLSGTLTGLGNANRQIVLQASPYPYRTAYANISGPILTDALGRFSFRVPNLTASTKFRVATVGVKPLYSLIVPEQVALRVVLKARSTSRAKGLVRLYGTVTPAEVGARVFVQLEKPPKEEEKPPKSEKFAKPEKPGKSGKSGKSGKKKSEKGPAVVTKFTTFVKPATKSISRFSVVVKIPVTGHYRVFVVIPPGALTSGHSQTVLLHGVSNTKKKKRKKH